MDTSTNVTVRYSMGTSETVHYFNGTVKGTLLHCYLINFVVINKHIYQNSSTLSYYILDLGIGISTRYNITYLYQNGKSNEFRRLSIVSYW